MKTDYKRSDRVADVLQKEIADLVLRRVKDTSAANLTVQRESMLRPTSSTRASSIAS